MEGLEDHNTGEKIKIERRTCQGESFYVDANGILKGEWGGYEQREEKGLNGEIIYAIYYTKFHKFIPIDEYGRFYNRFSCIRYDGISRLDGRAKDDYYYGPHTYYDLVFPPRKCDLFISEKNNRYGLLDGNGEELIHTCYKSITLIPGTSKFILTCETGKIVYDQERKMFSNVFECDEISVTRYDNLIYKVNGKFGLIDYEGNYLLKPVYESNRNLYGKECPLLISYNDRKYGLFVHKNKYYGVIPINEYDCCIRIGSEYRNIYITLRNGKYGILSDGLECVAEPIMDDIILYKGGLAVANYSKLSGKSYNAIFVIARKDEEYILFNTISKKVVLEGCKIISYREYNIERQTHFFFKFEKDDDSGYVTVGEKVLRKSEFDEIEFGLGEIKVVCNGKKGRLDLEGDIRIPCIYDEIEDLNIRKYKVYKDGVAKIVDLWPERGEWESSQAYSNYIERRHYSKYRGSYAQDEMGYSDEDIDTIFDGDPSA